MRQRVIGVLPRARRSSRRARMFALLATPVLAAGTAGAQQSGRTLSITPTFSVQQTVTNNVDLSATDKRSEAITQFSPGIQVTSTSGPLRGSLAYSLNALVYARDSEKNTFSNSLQNGLNAGFRASAIDNVAYADINASITQQTTSAFGTQPAGTGQDGGNSTEVTTLSVAPTLTTRLGGVVDASARVAYSVTNSAGTDAGDGSRLSAQTSLGRRSGQFGWALNSSREVDDFKAGRESTTDSAYATLQFFPVTELQLSLRSGWEASDAQGLGRRSNSTWGYGVDFRPGPRTAMSLQTDHRYFGRSHTVSVQHRMARSVWSYSDTRDVNAPEALRGQQVLTVYDLFNSFCLRAGGDPTSCDALTRAELALRGLQPTALVSAGFLSSTLSLLRSQRLSTAWSGQRTTFTLSGFRTKTDRLDTLVVVGEDLSSADQVRQQGFTFGASHRLTPTSSATLTLSQQKTPDAGTLGGNSLRSALLSWSDRLGRTVNVTLSLRRQLFTSALNPYDESAVIGQLSLRF